MKPASAINPDLMVYEANDCVLTTLRREDKVLPASVIRDFTEQKISEIEARELRTVGKKEKSELRDQVTDDLLPRAFTRQGRTRAYLDRDSAWLVVNAGSASKAEAMVTALREALATISSATPQNAVSPAYRDDLMAGARPTRGF